MYCPEDIHAFAPANDTTEVDWSLRTDNSAYIVNCYIIEDYKFPVGVTDVLCEGYNSSGILVGNCTFQVHIMPGTKYSKSILPISK